MTQVVETRYGSMECLSGDSVVSRSLLLYGEWAQLELDLIAKVLRPGDVALDVGAFLGTHTLGLATMVGPRGQVHSFEPRASIRAVLGRNVERNGLQQVTVHPFALGAKTEVIKLPVIDIETEANFGGLALEGNAVEECQALEDVRIEMLDNLALERVDFMKLDAEGMEAAVLAGATRLLATCQPTVLAECNDLEHGGRTLACLRQRGYEVYGVLAPAYNPANLRGESDNIFGEASEASILALPPSRIGWLAPAIRADLVPLLTLDDLALLLLHKAQYSVEVLTPGTAARVLGTDFASPLARRLRDEVAELRAALDIAHGRVDTAEQRATLAEEHVELAQRAVAAAQAVAATLQAHQLSHPDRRVRSWVARLKGALR